MNSTVLPISSRYRDAIGFTLFGQQLPIAVLGLLMLDGGHSARLCGIAMIGFWSASALILARRPQTPRASDLFYLRWGFLPVLVLTGLLAKML